jgi:peptidoglycan/LPS O-acetylase OafA/YrhL
MEEVVVREKAPWVSNASRHIVGLDGLRALAVIAVIAYHLAPSLLPGGYIGVDIFFVISGFLITTLLITEHTRTGKINLKKFWSRRAKRILPALIAVVCVISPIALLLHGDILVGIGRQILGALTFSSNWIEIVAGTNYFDASNPHLFTNFWSLAVEEQFYALWPLVILGALSLSFFSKRLKRAALLCLLLSVGSAVLMAIIYKQSTATRVYYGTDTHLFGLMLGASLAFWGQARAARFPQRRLQLPLRIPLIRLPIQFLGIVSLIGLITLMATLSEQSMTTYSGGLFLASALSTILILATISSHGFLQRLFSLKPLEWIGVRSYGIYLWHWPILTLLRIVLPKAPLWEIAALTCTFTILSAILSFRFLETPLRKVGFNRFIKRSIRREAIIIDEAITRWRVRIHPMLVPSILAVILTVTAVISAPAETQAQQRIQAGQLAVEKAQAIARAHPAPPLPPPGPKRARLSAAVTGNDMTLIGDSVTLASAPALETEFPGILIDAKVSRSLRVGGFDTVDALNAAGNLRQVVIVALATNGYYGTGNLDKLIAELGNRTLIFVTGHAPDDWASGNNQELHDAINHYPNVYIAEWDNAINAHPDYLGDDGVHPNSEAGEQLYATCIADAIARAKKAQV